MGERTKKSAPPVLGGAPMVAHAVAENLARLIEWAAKNPKLDRGPASINSLARAAGVSRPTVDRLLAGDAGPGIDSVERVARAYELEAWQLQVPSLDPSDPPTLREASESERELHRALREVQEKLRIFDVEREVSARKATPSRAAHAGRDKSSATSRPPMVPSSKK